MKGIGSTLDSDTRGQVGIGTLIIFIALVLVAAVAAGVLINTAGLLESRASDTGDDAQAQVSNQIEVVSATGNITDNQVGEVNLTVKKSAGSDAINLQDATIQYTSPDNATTLIYGATANGSSFSTTGITNVGTNTTLVETGERTTITIDIDALENGDGLNPSGEAELELVTEGGASTIRGLNVPDVLAGRNKTPV
jgi:flagellin-like protein